MRPQQQKTKRIAAEWSTKKEREKIGGRRGNREKSIKEWESRPSGPLTVYMRPKYDTCIVPFESDDARYLRLSSHPFSAPNSCRILSLLPYRTSLILTLPIFTSLSNKKWNSRKSPSSLSSLASRGNAESNPGGDDGRPLNLRGSTRRRRPRPLQGINDLEIFW